MKPNFQFLISNFKNKRESAQRGFTLVEILVSVGLFTIVMLMATSAVFTIVDANKKAHSLKLVMTNLNFALESMMKEVRLGSSYSCLVSGTPSGNCQNSPGGAGLRFVTNTGKTVEYTFSGGAINKEVLTIDPKVTITASEITIQDMKFYVFGTGSNDGQPRILIIISGYGGVGRTKSTFNIQSVVAQRAIDLNN